MEVLVRERFDDFQPIGINPHLPAAMFQAGFAPRASHQNASHCLGRRPKKNPPVLPPTVVVANPAHPWLMHESSRLQCESEEHTSELQSPDHLVCRLLLEKKNQTSRTGPQDAK